MKNYRFLAVGLLALGIVSCEPDLDNPIDEEGNVYSNGEADFTHYVALGNSFAGIIFSVFSSRKKRSV